ncbi:MAG TPA: acyl-[acyl-carrier-protein] thioesterase [Candidatus Olsenella pullicola]|nr:acyl-[acyl-carrier-protein] thioesterase [Candidatus Olsenella pullicola]
MYAFEGRVRYSECDETGRLSLVSAINYLQDCSTFQSAELGQGIGSLAGRNLAWVLADWAIEVSRLPRFGEKIRVSTWCYEMSHAHALRNFRIEDAAGTALVSADSRWFVFDVDCGHATRVPQDQLVYVSNEPRLDMAPLARRIRVSGEGEAAPCVKVAQSYLDTNHHVNNAQYVRLALDALESLGHEAPLGRIQVQYRSMALLGDVVAARAFAREDGWDVVLADETGSAYAIVRLQA